MDNYSKCKATQETFAYIGFLLEKIFDRSDNEYILLLYKLHQDWRVDLFNPASPEAARFTNRLPQQVWMQTLIRTPQDIEALVNGGSMLHNHPSYGFLLQHYGNSQLETRDTNMFDTVCKEVAEVLEEAVQKQLLDSRSFIRDFNQKISETLNEQRLLEELHLV